VLASKCLQVVQGSCDAGNIAMTVTIRVTKRCRIDLIACKCRHTGIGSYKTYLIYRTLLPPDSRACDDLWHLLDRATFLCKVPPLKKGVRKAFLDKKGAHESTLRDSKEPAEVSHVGFDPR
jgi:hypothetical protein